MTQVIRSLLSLIVAFALQTACLVAPFAETADAENNVKALNHLNLSLYKIANYNNKAILDEEYDTINNDIKLDSIGDAKLVGIIQELMDALTAFKISEMERARMQEAYESMHRI